jgi:hypothetical protein
VNSIEFDAFVAYQGASMKKSLVTGMAVLAVHAFSAAAATITVPGTADPWLAGMPDGSKASGGDSAPAQSPVLVQGLTPGRGLLFAATGSVTRMSGNAAWLPDGAEVTSHEAGAENGIAALTAPFESLVGVFLGPNQPSLSSPPAALDFGTRDKMDYSILRPQLRQVFFIGDGRTATGAGQLVVVPVGATRLFLGVMDRNESANNTGAFSVAITEAGEKTTLDPIQWTISSGGNGHYYQYVYGKRWVEARADALSRSFNGLPGYLANITSAAENSFIASLVAAVGANTWIGANDIEQEGLWVWADGPEAGLAFWSGTGSGRPLDGMFNALGSGEPDDNNNEDSLCISPLNGGSWHDFHSTDTPGYLIEYSTAMPPGYSALLQREILIATALTDRASTNISSAALKFLPPAGDGRGKRAGLVIKSDSTFRTLGSMWEFDYAVSENFPGVQVIHPYKDGQCIIAIYPDSAALRTPQRWTEIGYRQPGQPALGLSRAADHSKIFPLSPTRRYHVKSIVGATGNVSLFIDDLLVASGNISISYPIDFSVSPSEPFNGSSSWDSRQFTGDGFPLKWAEGFAGVLLEPIDNSGGAVNQMFQLNYSPGPVPPPVITEQLSNLTLIRGETATLKIAATGVAPLQYNWFFGTNSLLGETDATLTLRNVTTNQAGDYKVIVSSPSVVTATSRVARVTVTLPTPPAITQQPQNVTLDRGQTAIFTVGAIGSLPIRYQWYFANGSLAGETNATLTLRNVAPTQAGDYFVVVANPSDDLVTSQAARLAVIVPVAPAIVQPLRDATIVWGESASFTVIADGTPPFQYEWSFNGAGLPGQTNATLTVSNATRSQDGVYTVTVSNRTGSRATSQARLIVALPPPPIITQQPADVTVDRGQTATFSVTAVGTSPLQYQWSRSGPILSGATNATLTLQNVTTDQAGAFVVEVTNPSGVLVSSRVAYLTVFVPTPPAVTEPAQELRVAWGSTVTLSADVSGSPPFEYQWLFGANSLVSETNATLTLRNVTTAQAGDYAVQVRNRAGNSSGLAARLVVDLPPPPSITVEPADLTVDWGANATFRVGADGVPPFRLQWFFGPSSMSGQTNAVLLLPGVTTSFAGEYRVTVTNPSGVEVSSRAARLVVRLPPPPVITQQPADVTVGLGGTATFTVRASGTQPVQYQWFFGTNILAGQSNPTLTLLNVTTNLAGQYKVVVNDPSGMPISSQFARLTVNVPAPPVITKQPQDLTVDKDGTALFAVEASGSAPLAYQWFFGARSLAGEISSALTLRNVATNQAGVYRVIVSNPNGSVSSTNATLMVNDPFMPAANDLFANRAVILGRNVSVTNSNLNATQEAGEPNHAGNSGGKSIWWTWTAPQNGNVTISTAGSSADTLLAVYTGTILGGLATVASNDDDPAGGTSSLVKFQARAGVAYQIAVDTFGGQTGMIRLSLTAELELPSLRMSLSGQNLVLSWPTNATGFNLEASASLGTAAWSPVPLGAVITGENYSLKLPLSGSNQFYRLKAP